MARSAARLEYRAEIRQRSLDFDNALLRLRVTTDLLEELGSAALGLQVEVRAGDVTLSGEVGAKAHLAVAEDIALATPGVVRVRHRAEVTGREDGGPREYETADQRLADRLLAVRARSALVRELGRTAFDLSVEAVDAHLILRGELGDRHSRDLALTAAGRVEGIDQVLDLLRVRS